MKYQKLFSGENKKNISNCRLLKILPRVLSIKKGNSYALCRLKTIGRFVGIFDKGDNLCGSLFAFLLTNALLKRIYSRSEIYEFTPNAKERLKQF